MEEKLLNIRGKSYISSKRAATIFGYTTDYIGQLSRSGKINSIMVGRDRFIDYSSISTYVEGVKASQKSTIAISTPNKPIKTLATIEPHQTNSGNNIYDGLPQVKGVSIALVTILLAIGLAIFASTPLGKNGLSNLLAFSGARMVPLDSEMATVLSASGFTKLTELGSQIDDVYIGFLEHIQDSLLALLSNFRYKVLALFKIEGEDSSNLKSAVTEPNSKPNSSTALIDTKDVSGTQISLSESDVRLIAREVAEDTIAKTIDYASMPESTNRGVVTIPSTGNTASDTAIINQVRKSFSDEVMVSLDGSGASGVIRPIFRTPTDDKYLFVVVPAI